MLKNNLNVFYHFLRGGVEREINDNFGNKLYFDDSEEDEEVPNYYKTYKKNKGFLNEAGALVKKNNDKFDVVGKKQYNTDKQARINILVPLQNEKEDEEQKKKIDEFKKKMSAKKISKSAKKISEFVYNNIYPRVNPDNLKNLTIDEYLNIVKNHPKTKQDLEDFSQNLPSDEDEQIERANQILQNKQNIPMNDEIAKRSEENLSKILKRNLNNNNLDVKIISTTTTGTNTQSQKDIDIIDKTTGDIVGKGEFKQIKGVIPRYSPFSFGLNKILEPKKNKALPNSLVMASFQDGTGLIDFNKDATYLYKGQPLTKKRYQWINDLLQFEGGDINQLTNLKQSLLSKQRGYKKGDFVIDQIDKLIEFKTLSPEKVKYIKDAKGNFQIDQTTKKAMLNPNYIKPKPNKFPLITLNYLGDYYKDEPFKPGQKNEVRHLNSPPDWIDTVNTTRFEDLQLKNKKSEVIEYLKKNKFKI